MELKAYLHLLAKYSRLILGLGVLLGAVAYLVSLRLPTTYKASVTLFVKREIPAEVKEPLALGVFSQQVAEKYTETVVGFLKAKDIIKRGAEKANLPTDQKTLRSIAKSVRAREEAPQLVSLVVVRKDAQEAEALVVSLSQAAIERASLLNQTGDKAITIDLLDPRPIVEAHPPLPFLNALAALVSGALFGVLFASLVEYLRAAG